MTKKKLQRFAENTTFPHFFERSYAELTDKPFEHKGTWSRSFFGNDNPLVLEVGCGKGEYTVGLANRFPNKNFIGIDIKGARMWRGAKTIANDGIKNAAFVRSQAGLIDLWFAKNEVSEIWFTFPDPQPGARENKRLTSPRYLKIFTKVLKPDGIIHLKTDSDLLYEYTANMAKTERQRIIHQIDNVYNGQISGPLTEIQTFYEQMWLKEGKTIKYISFHLNPSYYEQG
ncbi:MAG: tRNA (guanosine(46)-N7)-methyltransferase TrmB [Marinilabiliales bacterium]|nr:MAG: tRNA (guanosine(46)-N7)-methyltransferase TrmB [Marinilabiliales bacterium]